MLSAMRDVIRQMAGDSGYDINHSEPESERVTREAGFSFHKLLFCFSVPDGECVSRALGPNPIVS